MLDNTFFDTLCPVQVAYATIYIGLMNPPRNPLVLGGDYSYGLFIYGFPLQQALAASPFFSHYWVVNMIVAMPVLMLAAFLSWWYVEKPALGLRVYLKKLEAIGYFSYRWWHMKIRQSFFSGKQ